ncbi:MAG TPA: flagellar biosynthesis protein, partial [Aliiroseovarius sp.]|nr:flagellar biosynthesis protein [Aliiroseovarius sp.]
MAPIFPLEEFKTESPTGSDAAQSGQTAGFTVEDLEQSRLAGYETGFKAGWDDAIRTETDEQARIGVEFARNLQDLGFTFNEARSHVMHALEPLLTSIVTTVLPKLVSETIGQTIVEELLPLAST